MEIAPGVTAYPAQQKLCCRASGLKSQTIPAVQVAAPTSEIDVMKDSSAQGIQARQSDANAGPDPGCVSPRDVAPSRPIPVPSRSSLEGAEPPSPSLVTLQPVYYTLA